MNRGDVYVPLWLWDHMLLCSTKETNREKGCQQAENVDLLCCVSWSRCEHITKHLCAIQTLCELGMPQQHSLGDLVLG